MRNRERFNRNVISEQLAAVKIQLAKIDAAILKVDWTIQLLKIFKKSFTREDLRVRDFEEIREMPMVTFLLLFQRATQVRKDTVSVKYIKTSIHQKFFSLGICLKFFYRK